MGLFKRAAARGVAHELVRRGVVVFPSKQAADEAADHVADAMPEEAMPEVSPEAGHSPESVAAVANQLMEIAQALMAQAHAQGGGAPGGELPPEVAKSAALLQKTAASSDLESLASEVAVACMDKAAEEVKTANPHGSLIHGGDKQNTPSAAAKTDEVAALDAKQRPEGAYHDGVGHTQLDTAKGEVGHLGAPTAHPSNAPSGTNSVNAGAKSASLQAELKKVANKLVGLHTGKNDNSPAEAAKTDTVAQLDQKQRPQGKYLVGQGNTNFSEPQDHRVGKEMKHPETPKNSPSGTNSVIQASKTGSELDEEQKAYLTLFKKCAEDVGPSLPGQLSEEEKVAAIGHMIGFDHEGRQTYLDSLYTKVAEEKGAKEKYEAKGMVGSEEKKDAPEAPPAPEAHKKESALLAQIREIAAKAAPATAQA